LPTATCRSSTSRISRRGSRERDITRSCAVRFSIGSAVAGILLTAATPAGAPLPVKHGYVAGTLRGFSCRSASGECCGLRIFPGATAFHRRPVTELYSYF
jgi:hypothetical protein